LSAGPATSPPRSRDLRPLFEPESVAILGASNDPAKWGHWLARGALRGAHRREVFLVNRNGGEIFGHEAHRSMAELPRPAELVILTLPAAAFEEAVDASLAAGAKAIVAISAGLGETGPEGKRREEAVVAQVREAGAVLLGPNCLGVFDAAAEIDLASNAFAPGEIGLISQSGNLAIEIGLLAADIGLGVSRFASLGNQADVEAAELVAGLAAHEGTRAIAVYCEDFRGGRAFAEAAKLAGRAGKPVLLITVGESEASADAARSHTGALVSDLAAVDAACKAAGIVRVESPRELVDVAAAFLSGQTAHGKRVAVCGDGGGHAVLAADLLVRRGLDLPRLSNATSDALAAVLPPTATTRNPVDLAGGGEQDISSFGKVVSTLLRSAEVDTVLLTGYFGGYNEYSGEFSEQEVASAEVMLEAVGGPAALLVHTMYWRAPCAWRLRQGRIPVYRDVGAAVEALDRLVRWSEGKTRPVPTLSEAAAPITDAGYFGSRTLLEAAGVPFADARRVTSWGEAREAAADVGYPVVLKALGTIHKSDLGGVVVGLADETALRAAFEELGERLEPPEFSVEAAAPVGEGLELIVGSRWDPRFGPVLVVGVGGLYAEIVRDVAVALAPATVADAAELMDSLRAAPLLAGVRGRPPLDVDAAARAAAALSRVAAEHPEIAELEINPLLVLPDGCLGLDARIVEGDADAR
jgi:acetate---CoA ligase (ADP-forming)